MRYRSFLLAAALAAGSAPEAPALVGISTHSLDPAEAPRYAAAGASVVRVDLPWSYVVHHDGEHWEAYDALVAALLRQRITPLLILHWDGEGPVAGEAQTAELARFAAAAAARYPVAMFELLNEPNLQGEAWPYVAPEEYSRLAATVMPAIRAAAPQARVLGPALAGPDLAYLRRAIAAGLLDQVDAVSVHPYGIPSPEEAPAFYEQVRRLMPDERPVVVSEWGFLAPELEQADLVRRALEVNAAAGIGLTVLYRWQDAPGHAFGLTREDGSEKPAVAVLRALAR